MGGQQAGPPPGMPVAPGQGGGMGGRGPTAKSQLASLVAKLDQLSQKPLAVNLNEDQRSKLVEQLKGLEDKADLPEEEAKKRLDAILEIVKSEKETLESAGYRWPGQRGGGGRPAADVANPFKDEQNNKHLKSLQDSLIGKTKTE